MPTGLKAVKKVDICQLLGGLGCLGALILCRYPKGMVHKIIACKADGWVTEFVTIGSLAGLLETRLV